MNSETIVQKAEKIIIPYAKDLGLDLVDVEYLQDGAYMYLRVYVEKEEGDITLEECATLSNAIEDQVDAIIKDKFFLEVSSPGLERPLKKEKDFKRFVGSKVKLILKHKIEDSRNHTGVLKAFEESVITLLVDEEKELNIPYNEVKKANLVFDFEDF
jgi:ribosome maturation factor RimP